MNRSLRTGVAERRLGWLGRLQQWLDAMPHPETVWCVRPDGVGAARWSRRRLVAFAEQPLPLGTLRPSSTQPNLVQPEALAVAVQQVLDRLGGNGGEMALLLPDPVVRVFVLDFETFPRRHEDALPLLRWRLRKSLPFPAEEAILSWFLQPSGNKLEAVTAVARQAVVADYERVFRSAALEPQVVLGSGLALLPLLEDEPVSVLLHRLPGSLTTLVVAEARLLLYRCTESTAFAAEGLADALLEEIAPVLAYIEDALGRSVERIWLAGCHPADGVLARRLEEELRRPAGHIESQLRHRLPESVQADPSLVQTWAPLMGWELNRGA